MKIAFLRDPLQEIDPLTETTLLLMYECYRRGHQVFFLEFHDLYIRDSRVMGRMHEIFSDSWPGPARILAESHRMR